MFHSFDIVIVGIFVITIGLICLLYRDALKDIMVLGKEQIIKFKARNTKG